jgi:imidazolonepropionase
MSRLLFVGASEIVTSDGPLAECVRAGAAILVEDGRIAAVTEEAGLETDAQPVLRVDCAGGVITPGFVDSHTHAVFGTWRAAEYALRSRGVPYMEIARRGGGINASVRDLRTLAEDDLFEISRSRLASLLQHGTTTVEIKSGYGLDTESELKQLRVIRRLQQALPLGVIPRSSVPTSSRRSIGSGATNTSTCWCRR